MFSPCSLFSPALLHGLLRRGNRFFVRQTLRSGKAEHIRGSFLFTHYREHEAASRHFSAIGEDPNRFLYDASLDEHRKRLEKAAAGGHGYAVYSSLFREDWKKELPPDLAEKVKRYAASVNWRPKGKAELEVELVLDYGRLFLELRAPDREARITFEELENLP